MNVWKHLQASKKVQLLLFVCQRSLNAPRSLWRVMESLGGCLLLFCPHLLSSLWAWEETIDTGDVVVAKNHLNIQFPLWNILPFSPKSDPTSLICWKRHQEQISNKHSFLKIFIIFCLLLSHLLTVNLNCCKVTTHKSCGFCGTSARP